LNLSGADLEPAGEAMDSAFLRGARSRRRGEERRLWDVEVDQAGGESYEYVCGG